MSSNGHVVIEQPPMVFDAAATKVLNECLSIATQRGGEYCDSWKLDNLAAQITTATLKGFGIELSAEQTRLVLLSALVDVKLSRITSGGAFKRDSYVDCLNYLAALTDLREQYEKKSEPGK